MRCGPTNRGLFVAACLTIGRAYIAAGRPGRLPPLASYEGWSDSVRSASVWLGRADPVGTMDASRRADPVRTERAEVFAAWRAELGIAPDHHAGELAEATERDGRFIRPALRAAPLAVAAKRPFARDIDARRLGLWLKSNENTIADGHKLTADRSDKARPRWRLFGLG